MMKVQFMNPFVYAFIRVLATEAQVRRSVPTKPSLIWADKTQHAVNVVIGVMGSVQGLVIYGLDLGVAKAVIRSMVGSSISMSDPMAESALGELGNLITGVALGVLESNGYPCRISPPAIVQGTGRSISRVSIPMVMVPIDTDIGEIRIYLALRESAQTGGAPA